MYSRRSTVNGFPMCVEGLQDFSNKADTSDSPTVRFLVLVPPLHVVSRLPDSSCCILPTLNSAPSHQQTRQHLLPLPKVAAAWIESVFCFFFLQPAQQPKLFYSSHQEKGFQAKMMPAPLKKNPLTAVVLFIRNVWSKQKKSQISPSCPSQCPILKPLNPFKIHTLKKKKKCFIERQKYSVFSRCPVFHQASCEESYDPPTLEPRRAFCRELSEASTELLLSTTACLHTLINQHMWVQSKQGLFTESDRFTNTVWTGLTSLAAGDSLDHSGFLQFWAKK